MGWADAEGSMVPEIHKFLLPREVHAASLSSRLLNGGGGLGVPGGRGDRLLVHRGHLHSANGPESLEIDALLYLGGGGFTFPLFSGEFRTRNQYPSRRSSEFLEKALFQHRRRIFSIMGGRDDTEQTISMMGKPPYHRVDYVVMFRTPQAPAPPLSYDGEFRIVRSGQRDIQSLLPLQLAYEAEEVVIPGKSVNPSFTLSQLRRSLSSQRVLHLMYGDRVVAKAQTNARGMGVEQIGGVYTLPEYRNRGLGSMLVEKISRDICGDGKVASLFVKRENQPAMRVYEKCGFEPGSRFLIGYF